MSSLKRHDGELEINHQASPGVPDQIAIACGLPLMREGSVVRAATFTCWHCRTVLIKNPQRVRPREYCRKCDMNICDACAAEAAKAGYVHRSFNDLADAVRSGKYKLAGGGPSAPILVPTFTET